MVYLKCCSCLSGSVCVIYCRFVVCVVCVCGVGCFYGLGFGV